MAARKPDHKDEHGWQFLVLFSDGANGNSFVMRFNAYEFFSPYEQAFHESTVICKREGKKLESVLATPIRNDNPHIKF